jgi:hypothetical protein
MIPLDWIAAGKAGQNDAAQVPASLIDDRLWLGGTQTKQHAVQARS